MIMVSAMLDFVVGLSIRCHW